MTEVIVKKNILEGFAHFSDIDPVPSKFKSFQSENVLLNKLRPSQVKSKIKRIVEKWIKYLLSYFVIHRPDIMKEKLAHVIRAGGAYATTPFNVTFGQLWTHYKRFLSSDQQFHPQIQKCFNELEKDESFIQKIQMQKAASHDPQPKVLKQQSQFVERTYSDIQNLSEGKSRLFILQREPDKTMTLNGKLFCIVSKKAGHYTLRFVGTGQVMSELAHDGKPIPLGGKEKVSRELCFENIPQTKLFQGDWIKLLLNDWSDFQNISTQFIQDNTKHLTSYKKDILIKNDLTNCSERVDHLFWNVMQAFSPEKSALTHANQKRVQLRANLLSLYHFFQEMREDLTPHSANYQILLQLLEGVSKNFYLAAKKGNISQEEVESVNRELAEIEKALQAAKKSPVSIPSKLSSVKTSLKSATTHPLPIQEMQKVKWENEVHGHSIDGVLPSKKPILIPSLQSLPPLLYHQIDSTEKFLTTFRDICKKVAANSSSKEEQTFAIKEFQRLFNEVPYQLFVKKEPNKENFWWKLTKEESIEVMEKINEYTKIIMDSLSPTHVSQYEYESLMKMTRLVSFLNARTSNYWISTWDSYDFRPYNRNNGAHNLHRTQPDYLSAQFYLDYRYYDDEEHLSSESKYEKCMGAAFTHAITHRIKYSNSESMDFYKPYPHHTSKIEIPKQEIQWTKKQHRLIESINLHERTFQKGSSTHSVSSVYNHFLDWTPLTNWIRPIQNPHLMALYRQVYTSVTWESKYKSANEENESVMCPEAYQKEPQNIFTYFLEQAQGNCLETDTSFSDLSQFSKKEMTRLLHLLRKENPQVELIAFMRESPHLMRNPDVRNFFDALFFDYQLDTLLKVTKKLFYRKTKVNDGYFSKQIQEEIDSLEGKIKDSLKKKSIQDPLLFRERIDTLLYYYEMKEKLHLLLKTLGQPTDQITSSKTALEEIYKLCQERVELSGSLGIAARVQMRVLLHGSPLDLPQIFRNYAAIKGGVVDHRNIDPYFEEELERYWQEIVKKCEKDNPDLQSFLDQLCYAKDLPLDGSQWVKETGMLYRNSLYTVNLKTCQVSENHSQHAIRFLPSSMTSNSHFKLVMGESDNWRAKVQNKGNQTLYSFADLADRPVQIEQTQEKFTIYKKFNIDGGLWLQSYPLESLFLPFSEKATLFSSLFKKGKEKSNELPPFFDHGVYINPQNPHDMYCVDRNGEITLKFNFTKDQNHLTFHNVTDYRTHPPTHYKNFLTASQMKSEALDALVLFENKDKTILWSDEKGLLKKVELPRYDLSFLYENGRLICEHPSFRGYTLDLSATLQEKKGLRHALVLEHPDPTKPKKLLIPEANALHAQEQYVSVKGSLIAKIMHYLKVLYNLYFNGKPPEIQLRWDYEMNPNRKAISYHSFEIRPYTGELCHRNSMTGTALLEAVKQALMLDQPTLAQELLQMMEISPKKMDHRLLKELNDLIHTPVSGNGAEAALKIKLCFKMKNCLKQQHQLTKKLRSTLNHQMMHLGKQFYQYGRKIPKELQLSIDERTFLAHLYQKYDQEYYNAHVKAIFLADGEKLNPGKPIQENDTLATHLQAAKKELSPKDIHTRILALEKESSPESYLSDKDLAYTIPRLSGEGISLIDFSSIDQEAVFQKKVAHLPDLILNPLAGKSSCEKTALEEAQKNVEHFKKAEQSRPRHVIQMDKQSLKKLIETKIVPQKAKWEEAIKFHRCQIEEMIRKANDPIEQLAIYGGNLSIASFDELRKAMGQGNLEALQKAGRLPSSLEIEKLHQQLTLFFDALSHRNAIAAAMTLTNEILIKGDPTKTEEWESLSEGLYRLLTIQRFYDANKEPRLLVFEAQQFINFKPVDGGLDQLDLLETLVRHPQAIVQASTGAGKTSVLSVLRSLLKANGKNLSIQKVLPSLYQQTHDKLKNILSDLYGTAIYPLRFNLKMRMTTTETNSKQEKIAHSIFKGIYCDLLETKKNKGCVLTDYKSLPLLEEMFFKVGRNLVANHEQGLAEDPILKEHFTYLRKILIFLKNQTDENMDEFDQPNRPIQKIQLDLGVGSHALSPFLIDTSLQIFELLKQEKSLGLLQNIQGDIAEDTRKEAIRKGAEKMTVILNQEAGNILNEKKLLDYLLGENEEILADMTTLPLSLKDRIVLCKDQFSIYLPLTLGYKEGSRYARSSDGSKTLPCYSGEKHDAKFGTILEQFNYTIQDYLQTGITKADLKPWILGIKQEWDEMADGGEKDLLLANFHAILPKLSLFQASQMLDKEDTTQVLIKQINEDPAKILLFLKKRLQNIHTSGDVISMDPQNIVDMSRAVSGISATMGASESLHRNFEVNAERNGQIQASMLYRLVKRAETEKVIAYDPEKPSEMLSQTNGTQVQVIIDGAGAFKDAHVAAQALKSAFSNLGQVGYHKEDDTIAFVGQPTGKLDKTGFFFSQQRTRGTDIQLDSNAKAILTLTRKDGMREFCQKEGRLRKEQQRYLLAMPKYQNIKTITEEMEHAIAQEALVDALDIFRKSKQELHAILRAGKKKRLLEAATLDDFIQLFQKKEYWGSFIREREPHYDQEGSYFQEHRHIRRPDANPLEELQQLKATLIKEAQELGLQESIQSLEKIDYSKKLLDKMPEKVAPIGAALGELETEVESEQEEECEAENELEVDTEQNLEEVQAAQHAIGSYAKRLRTTLVHSVAKRIHPAYHEKIEVTDAFLPFSRIDAKGQYQRFPFDENMFRVGQIYFKFHAEEDWETKTLKSFTLNKVYIQDPLEEFQDCYEACYDIRTNRIIRNQRKEYSFYNGEYTDVVVKSPEFIEIVAQIKFFDCRLSGYSDAELAALSAWLKKNDPVKMKDHLFNQILRYRHKEKEAYVGSQLQQLFDHL